MFHLWLSPFCRKVRLVLHEKRLEFQMKTEGVWERRPEFLGLNPAGEVPVLLEVDGSAVGDQIAVWTLNRAVVDVSHDVSAGSVVTLKYDHIQAKAVGGMAWIYAKSLPWI